MQTAIIWVVALGVLAAINYGGDVLRWLCSKAK
jgi:hypothetical protein